MTESERGTRIFKIADIRVAQFCQKFKIQNVNPLRCWIGSNGFQKVQKLENLCMLKTAPTHFFVYEVILLKKIFRHICFCLKTILPMLKTFWPLKIIFEGGFRELKSKDFFKIAPLVFKKSRLEHFEIFYFYKS